MLPLNFRAVLFLGDVWFQCPKIRDFSFVSYLEVAWVTQIPLALLPWIPPAMWGWDKDVSMGFASLAPGLRESWNSPYPEVGALLQPLNTQSLGILTLWELDWSCWIRGGDVTPWKTHSCSEGLGQSVLGDISEYWDHQEG